MEHSAMELMVESPKCKGALRRRTSKLAVYQTHGRARLGLGWKEEERQERREKKKKRKAFVPAPRAKLLRIGGPLV